MADLPTVDLADFGLDKEEYWKKFAAQHSGGASVSAPPPRSTWQVLLDTIHSTFSPSGSGQNATFLRGNQADREDDLVRMDAQNRGMTPQQAQSVVQQNQMQRAAQIQEQRAQRETLMAAEQAKRSPVGRVAAKAAEMAGNVVGDVNPTYALPAVGESALARMLGMGAVSGGGDLSSQIDEYRRKIRDSIDPLEVGASAAAGAAFQGAGEVVGKAVAKGAQALKNAFLPKDIVQGLLDRGLTPVQARGVTAGIVAESRANPTAFNKDSGAMGYGQWLGSRKDELIRRYGPNPTHDQQLDFLVHELNGGDHGGPKVLAQKDQKGVLNSYITDFMRPAKGKETTGDLRRGSEALGQPVGEGDAGDTSLVRNEQPSVSQQADANSRLAPSQKLEDLMPNLPFHDESKMGDLGYVRSVVDDRWMTREDAHDEAHQLWVDKNFPEGTVVHGYGHNIDEHGDYKPEEAVRAIEDQDSEIAKARRAKDYVQASDMIDQLHSQVADINASAVDEGHPIDVDKAENTRSLINDELTRYEPDTPEHNKLLEIDDMLKEAIAHSGGKPRIYAPDASEKFLGGEPKTDAANNRFPVYDAPVPGKTLHEYTDAEWRNLGPIHKKALIDEANAKIFNPSKKYDPPAPGKTLHEYTDTQLNSLHPADKANLVRAANEKLGMEVERDANPPASMGNEGPAASRPDYRANKPENELKAPDGHEDAPELPRIDTNKKLVIDKLGDLLEQGKPLRREAEAAIMRERSRRLAAVYSVRKKQGGEQGFYAELAALKGEMGRPKVESIRDQFTPKEINQLFDIVKNSPALEGYETINAQNALKKLLGADYGEIPTGREIELLAKAMPQKAKIWRQMLEDEGGALNLDALPDGAVKRAVINVAGLPRTLKASFDFSAPFRQGMFLVGRKEFWKAMPGMFKSFFSEGHFNKLQQEIFDRPTYPLMNRAGLQTTKNNAGLVDREEAFVSQFAEKIPGVRHSERAYIAFLNRVRADVFDDFVAKGERLGIDFVQDPHYLKSAAKFINAATGRGDIKMIGRNAQLLGNVLFSPKLMASRIQLLNPAFYAGLHPKVRAEAAKSGLVYAGTVMSMLGLAAAAGASVDMDPRSSDFAKIKVGNTRFDVTGGMQPYVRFYAQFLTGQQKGINDGEVRNVGTTFKALRDKFPGVDQGPYKPTTRKDLVYRFFENKEAPNAAEVTRLLQEQDAVGNKLGTNTNPISDALGAATGQSSRAGNEVAEMVTPLIVSDTYQAMKDLGPSGAITAIPNAVGIGVQTYTPKKGKDANAVKLSDFGVTKTVSLKDFQ